MPSPLPRAQVRPILVASLLAMLPVVAAAQQPRRQRSFRFDYHTVVHFPAGTRQVRVWIPVAQSNAHQQVRVLAIHAPGPYRLTRSRNGDNMLYAELRRPAGDSAAFDLRYQVRRRLYRVGDFQQLLRLPADPPGDALSAAQRAYYLRANRLVPVTGTLQRLAAQVTRGAQGRVAKAHAIYLYIFHTLRYDKSGTGWGHGNAMWACDHKRGNCTDFHSLFLSMARSQGIPSRFVIGFPIPRSAHAGAVEGYHCWAEFYVAGRGWVPLDIAMAWLNKPRANFYFGAVDASRVRFSAGRDLTLAPPQAGPPVNYFVYPYVEVDGRPDRNVTNHFSFRDTVATP
ncbi:MAG: transglutaminase-like domain-containing protein [Terriglobales bacterium]